MSYSVFDCERNYAVIPQQFLLQYKTMQEGSFNVQCNK